MPAPLAYSTGVYNTLLFLHILAAIVWLGSGVFAQVYATRLRRVGTEQELAQFAGGVGWIGARLLTAASLLVLLMGVSMVVYSPAWNFSDTWVLLGLAGYAATFVTGAFFLGPSASRLSKLIEEKGIGDPAVAGVTRRILAISRIDLVVLTLAVLDMVFKPGT